ncbi:DUF262 domain-containing protein [Phaeodactylibacter xiamenensis]|uniref:DUF262 domain-containing protein n=1 Tax=Phaeodactylibacter xiamenensis TaxID=1524460 RepID=UPI003BABA8EC
MSAEVKNLDQIGLLSIGELNRHEGLRIFYVASYQRGYRWGVDEVTYLLDDINGIEEGKKYCIQPLAVARHESSEGEPRWELIDGQQRTTTVYLIQAVLKNNFSIIVDSFYAIDYRTRDATKDFLEDIKDENILEPFWGADVESQWINFAKEYPDKDNVDNYHLFQAYFTIYNWLTKLSPDERNQFHTKLLRQTYVIWHPVNLEDYGTQTVEDFFINMNAGKIKLTSAELIKALFITDIDKSDEPWDIRDFKKKKLANEWDAIENELHNDTFWYFINNNEQDYPTRIGKLFDIDCGKTSKADDLYAYFQYVEKETLDWEEIKNTFQRLKEWYDDVESYHLIGFLINAGIKSLEEIISETENKKKSDIRAYFQKEIKDKFGQEKKKDGIAIKVYALDNLRYDASYDACQHVLLFYNIRLIETRFPGQRFPFDLYQNPDTKWSIEHIHPQNPRKLTSKADALEWLSDYEARLKDEGSEAEEELGKIEELKNGLNLQEEESLSIELSNQLKEFADLVNDALGLHGIGNLALLDKNTNTKIGNKNFLEKRKRIIYESDKGGQYIPLGTIQNFLKKTTKAGEDNTIKMSYWSAQDAEDYTKDIERLLTDYLPPKADEL